MNSTVEYWGFNGISLHQAGWGCTSLGQLLGSVPLRGDNQKAVGVAGELFTPKIPDARTLTLSMWTIGVDPATGDNVDDPRMRFSDSYAYLQQLFWSPESEGVLTRRWKRTDPTTGQGQILICDAMAQVAAGEEIRPTMTGRARATFDIPLRLAHPFFYGPTQTATCLPGVPLVVTNPGDWSAFSKYFYVDLVGPLTAPKLVNATSNVTCGITGSIAAGETVTLDVRQFIALSTRGSVTTNRTNEIYNSGTQPWMALRRGDNTMLLTAAGAGSAVLRFRPPYM